MSTKKETLKRGNELKKPNNSPKVFLYTDDDFDLDSDNVFVSGVYKNVSQFRKLNEGMRPLISYDAADLITALKTQLKDLDKKSKKK